MYGQQTHYMDRFAMCFELDTKCKAFNSVFSESNRRNSQEQ